MDGTNEKKAAWKQKILHEMVEYYVNFVYMALFLVAHIWYRRLILAEYHIIYTNYWWPLIEAAVLAKVIMIGDILRLGRGLEQRSLILPTLYRTVVFSVWVGVFSLLEATVRGLLDGKGVAGGLYELMTKDWHELVAGCVLMFVAFIPFFGVKELGRVLGEGKLRALFFRRRTTVSGAALEATKEG